jgi:hypothetical protein
MASDLNGGYGSIPDVRDERSRAIQKALLFQTYDGRSIWRHRMGAKSQRRSVEAWLRGTAEGVEAVIADMRRGPRSAEVANLRIEARPRIEDGSLGFEVRRTV